MGMKTFLLRGLAAPRSANPVVSGEELIVEKILIYKFVLVVGDRGILEVTPPSYLTSK